MTLGLPPSTASRKLQQPHFFIDLTIPRPHSRQVPCIKCPFIPLAGELPSTCRDRYDHYVSVWKDQARAIDSILATVNDSLFFSLLEFAMTDKVSPMKSLPIAFLQMGSNIANNSRVLLDLANHLHLSSVTANKCILVTLDAKLCHTTRSAARSIVKQFCAAAGMPLDAGVNYDLNILGKFPDKRLVVLLRDANAVQSLVLNQIIALLHACCIKRPSSVRCIFGLSAQSIQSWLKHRLSRSMRSVVDSYPFAATGSVNQDIINRLFLNVNLPLMLDANLVALLSNRFQNASSSVDSLISEVKFCYLTHYYQLPLPVLLHCSHVVYPEPYAEALRRLASFKLHLETLLAMREPGYKARIKTLLTSSSAVMALFERDRHTFLEYHRQILKTIQLIEAIQQNFSEKLQTLRLYTLLVSSTLLSSPRVTSLFKQLRHAPTQARTDAANRAAQIDEELGSQLISIISTQDSEQQPASFVTAIKAHISGISLLSKPITNLVFYEVFTLNGDSRKSMTPQPLLEESISNLMLSTLRPPLRPLLELALDDPEMYLDQLHSKEHVPTLSFLFRVLKEAPQSINIYDFYVAFRESLDQNALMPLLDGKSDQETWEKATYAWFLQNCHELILMGFLREKAKGELFEKAIWKGL